MPQVSDSRMTASGRTYNRTVVIAFITLACVMLGRHQAPAFAQDEADAPPEVATPIPADPDLRNPALPISEFESFLVPLTKAELEDEAKAWYEQVRAKAGEVVAIESRARQAEGEAKEDLLTQASERRAERKNLIEHFDAVIDSLEQKGGEVEEYRAYIAAVASLTATVDVKDTSAIWFMVRNWFFDPDGGIKWGLNIIRCFVVIAIFWVLARIIGAIVVQGVKRVPRASTMLTDFLAGITRKSILLIGLILAASTLGINIGPMLAAIGAVGFIVGFALQGTLANFAAGIMLLLYRPYDIGNYVTIADVSGTVKSMTMVSTTITTPDNQIIVVPNGSIWGGIITNVTGSATRRVDLVFGIGYTDDIDRAKEVIMEVISSHELTLSDPEPVVELHEFGDSSVNFVARPWCRTSDYWRVKWDINTAIKKRFDAEGISIPFPQRDVHLFQESAT